MKYFLFAFFAVFTLLSCQNSQPTDAAQTTTEPAANESTTTNSDQAAINDVIHNFYKWYEANMEAVVNIGYVKGGKSTTLIPAKLDEYYALIKQSNCISQAYVDADRAYLQNLEATTWKSENVEEEPLSGLDYDRFFCAQDFDIAFWETAPVSVQGPGTDKVLATMSGNEGGSPREQQFELVKENGKWLIAKIICE